MTDKNKLADELHAFIAAAPHEYPGHLVELLERVEAALRSSADSADTGEAHYLKARGVGRMFDRKLTDDELRQHVHGRILL